MANGTITLTASGKLPSYLNGRIVWSSTSNGTAANTSSVTAQLQISRNSSVATSGTWYGSFTVGGTTKQISYYASVGSSWVTIDTVTATVTHNADGSGSCYIYCVLNGPTGTSMEGTYVSGSATVTLDAIARYASLVSVTNFTDEGNPVISYSNPAGAAVDSLQVCISLDGSTANIGYKDVPKTGTSYTFSLTESERNTLRSATPKSNTLNVYVLLKTVIGSGSDVKSTTTQMSIVNANPTLSVTVVDTSSTTDITGNSSILVAEKSTARVTMSAGAKKYATITSRKVEHGTQTLTGDGVLSVTNNPIKITIADSRDNLTVYTAPNTIVPYFNPTCYIGNNMPEADGSFTLEVSGLFYNGAIGKTSNSLTVQYRFKAAGGSYGDWITFNSVTLSGNSYTATLIRGGLDYQTVYTFQARVIDALNASGVTSPEKGVISRPIFDWGQYDFNFNVPVTFGAGLSSKSVLLTSADDLNNIKTHGWYQWSLDDVPANAPSGNGTNYMRSMRVWANSYECYQEVIDMTDSSYQGCMVRRTIYDRTAYPWEWINPPMVLGNEYRTAERFNGKPVYAKMVSFGSLPNNTSKQISSGVSNMDALVDYSAYAAVGGSCISLVNLYYIYDLRVGNNYIYVQTNDDMSGWTECYFTLKYTKTTD